MISITSNKRMFKLLLSFNDQTFKSEVRHVRNEMMNDQKADNKTVKPTFHQFICAYLYVNTQK